MRKTPQRRDADNSAFERELQKSPTPNRSTIPVIGRCLGFDAGADLLFYPGMPAPPDQLFLRPTEIGGQKHEDDYLVIWDGISIGRILKQPGIPHGRPDWSWGVGFPHKPQQAWMRGIERDLDECKRRFKLAWSGVYARLTPEDIEKARRQEADDAKRWKDR